MHLGTGDQDAVLRACIAGSRAARHEFDRARATALPDPVRDMVVAQTNELRETAEWLDNLLT